MRVTHKHPMWLCNCLKSFIFFVPFQLFAYIFLSRASKSTGNRQTYFPSLNNLRFWLFLILETFSVFLEHIVYNILLYYIVGLLFKVQFRINSNTSSLTDETDFVNISPICGVCESM